MARPAMTRNSPSDPLDMHRLHWPESVDLETTALVFALNRAREATHSLARAVWARHGLTPAEFDVLATLRRSPAPRELTPSALRASLVITSGGLTKVMCGLEARRLVARSRPRLDQRVKPVKLTSAGRHLVEKAMTELIAVSRAAIGSVLATAEIATLTGLLDKLAPKNIADRRA
jgi:DNA-binding MarR family transcriptional regulator